MIETVIPSADVRLTSFVNLMDVVRTFYQANPVNQPKHMDISREDVTDLFRSLNYHNVRYLLVGGIRKTLVT